MTGPVVTAADLDVLRGCGDHVYPREGCPHCTNNSALIDKVIPIVATALAAVRAEQAALLSDAYKAEGQAHAKVILLRARVTALEGALLELMEALPPDPRWRAAMTKAMAVMRAPGAGGADP